MCQLVAAIVQLLVGNCSVYKGYRYSIRESALPEPQIADECTGVWDNLLGYCSIPLIADDALLLWSAKSASRWSD